MTFLTNATRAYEQASRRLPQIALQRLAMARQDQATEKADARQRQDDALRLLGAGIRPSPEMVDELVESGRIPDASALDRLMPSARPPKIETVDGVPYFIEQGADGWGLSPVPGVPDASDDPGIHSQDFIEETGQTVLTMEDGSIRLQNTPEGYRPPADGSPAGLSPQDKAFNQHRDSVMARVEKGEVDPMRAFADIRQRAERLGIQRDPEWWEKEEASARDADLRFITKQIPASGQQVLLDSGDIITDLTDVLEGMQRKSVREKMGGWNNRLHDWQRFLGTKLYGTGFRLPGNYEGLSEDDREAVKNVEEWLTLIGLTEDQIVRMRSGAAVPPSEAERFQNLIGSSEDPPSVLEGRLRGAIAAMSSRRDAVFSTAALIALPGDHNRERRDNAMRQLSSRVEEVQSVEDLQSEYNAMLTMYRTNNGFDTPEDLERFKGLEAQLKELGWL